MNYLLFMFKKLIKSKYIKIIMSVLIISSTVPTIISDFTNNDDNGWEHYGLMLIGLFYLIQGIIDLLELWVEE